MAKKYKGKKGPPNAPDLETVLLQSPIGQQPPHNPYYPNLDQVAPPPYTDLTTDRTRMTTDYSAVSDNNRYKRFSNNAAAIPTVVVQQTAIDPGRDFFYARKYEQVRKFNNTLAFRAFLIIAMAFSAMHLYSRRPCIDDFVIHQLSPDHLVRVADLERFHANVIYLSFFMLVISWIKCACGASKSHSCYLFLMAMCSFVGMLFTGYMAYLSFYNPCVISVNEIVQKAGKTLMSEFFSTIKESVSGPELGRYGETNVFNYVKEDKFGLGIFIINVMTCFSFFANFVSSITLC